MAVDVIVVHSIPRGSLILVPGVAEADREKLRADLEAAVGHDQFAVLFPEDGAQPPGVVAPEAYTDVLKATIAEDTKAELVDTAREEARSVAAAVAGGKPIPPPTQRPPRPRRASSK